LVSVFFATDFGTNKQSTDCGLNA